MRHSFERICEARNGQMTNLDIITVTLALGGLISLVTISFALTTDVLRGYVLTSSIQPDRKENT